MSLRTPSTKQLYGAAAGPVRARRRCSASRSGPTSTVHCRSAHPLSQDHGEREELYRWLRLEGPTGEDLQQGRSFPPGFCHFPRYSEEYFRQLTAEQLITRTVKGYQRHEWQKTRERNEALDCRVYARAAAGRVGLDRFQEKHWKDLELALGIVKVERKPLPADYIAETPQQPKVPEVRRAPARGRPIIIPPTWHW